MVQGLSELGKRVSAGRNGISKRRNAGKFPTSAGKARTDEPKTYQVDLTIHSLELGA